MSAIAVICPGVHAPSLTESFINSIDWQLDLLVFPTDVHPAYSGIDLYNFVNRQPINSSTELILIGFSAGVVGAIAAAGLWQLSGRKVKAIIAFDGWGVPLFGFEIYRFSHDRYTHITSSWLGSGKESFYAEPAVAHLDLWRSPHLTKGYSVSSADRFFPVKTPNNAASYLQYLLAKLSN